MRKVSRAAGSAGAAMLARSGGRKWFLLDLAMTAVMIAMTSVFVGTLAMSMS